MNSLAAFEASARLLSFTRAGQELLISREAVSRKIRILESHLGVKLFVRRYRSLELTPAGNEFQSVVTESLAGIVRSAAALRRLNQPSRIKVTATIAITSFWLTPRLPRFRAQHPEVEIHVNVSDEPIDMAAEGVDVGLRYGTGNWPGLESTWLFDVESFPVCSPGHLRAASPVESPPDLLEQTLLYLNGPMHSLEDWTWWMEKFGVRIPASVRSLGFDSYANVVQAALDGQGFALGFSHILDDLLSQGLLVRPIDHTCAKGHAVYLIVPGGMILTPNAGKFFDWIVGEAESEVAGGTGPA